MGLISRRRASANMAVVDFGPAGSALRQPPEPPRIISALTSDYMSGQLCQNKRRAGGNVAGILTDCRKRQPPLGEKPATFHKQVPTCGPPGAGCSAARSLRRGIYPGGVPGALSGQVKMIYSNNRSDLNRTSALFIQCFVLPADAFVSFREQR